MFEEKERNRWDILDPEGKVLTKEDSPTLGCLYAIAAIILAILFIKYLIGIWL